MRIMHTMLRVVDLDKSINFYTNVLKMREIKRKEYPEGRFTLVFLGYGNEDDSALIELTHNWDTTSYQLGDAFGHIAIGVQNMSEVCGLAAKFGGKVTREPGPMKFGGNRSIAFIADPDDYKIELIEDLF